MFEPLAKLAPRADAIFRLDVKLLEKDAKGLKIEVTSANLTEPVIRTDLEPNRIISGAPEDR